jgi:DNA polymerase-1
MTPTVNREALEKISAHFYAHPIVFHLLKMRDQAKRIGVLKTDIDPDHRIRTSYNIAGTTTGRLSSSFSDFGTGTNLQNIEQRLRRIFIADPGYKFANIDLKSGDSFGVGLTLYNLFGDSTYLDACETGDIHTSVARMTWKDLPWTSEINADKKIAEATPGYREHSVRDLSKKLGHGTNYYGKPPTMAKHTKLPIDPIKDFQARYFAAFPIQKWHGHVEFQLRSQGYLVSVLGRKRWFFGRRDDDATLREAIAYEPQSITSDVINRGLLNVWRANICQVLLQVHDSILVQYPEELENTILPRILKLMEVPIQVKDRTVIIPAEAKIGWNWANVEYNKSGQVVGNPDGLVTYKGKPDERKRGPQTSILDRSFRGVL